MLKPAVRGARHHIEAGNALEAADFADDIIFDAYPKTDGATFRLLDTSGLVSTRRGEGQWVNEQEVPPGRTPA
jgi:hypothetical protein